MTLVEYSQGVKTEKLDTFEFSDHSVTLVGYSLGVKDIVKGLLNSQAGELSCC